MTVTPQANLRNVNALNNNFIDVEVPLVFTGIYTTALTGDLMSLAALIADLPTQEIISAFCTSNSVTNTAIGQAGGTYVPQGQPGPFGGVNNVNAVAATSPALWRLKIFTNGSTELGTGAYPATVTSDYVMLHLRLRKLGAL
jgi:hypothetical protein